MILLKVSRLCGDSERGRVPVFLTPASMTFPEFQRSDFSRREGCHQHRALFHLQDASFPWCCHTACEIVVPRPGIEPGPSALKVQSLNLWTTREVPRCFPFILSSLAPALLIPLQTPLYVEYLGFTLSYPPCVL